MCENVVRDGGEPCFSSVQVNLIYFLWESQVFVFFNLFILFYFIYLFWEGVGGTFVDTM